MIISLKNLCSQIPCLKCINKQFELFRNEFDQKWIGSKIVVVFRLLNCSLLPSIPSKLSFNHSLCFAKVLKINKCKESCILAPRWEPINVGQNVIKLLIVNYTNTFIYYHVIKCSQDTAKDTFEFRTFSMIIFLYSLCTWI